ncbi:uncharacterized protein LOC119798042 [Cyprinodon tularosa]|uniref:uncharacterized protein LOC119798042 n=1 Tax=Cyprinodon tularosa TaxID=77115 RepID=UPI0018E24AFC|nr:uncharacterized protein LOC119798042 [Cyprinodon tularosa]
MEQQSNQVDVESQKSSARRRGSCVTVFLGISVLMLFVAVAALAVWGMLVVKELRSELHDTTSHVAYSRNSDPSSSSSYKMQNFVYVKLNQASPDNVTTPLELVKSGEGTSVGSNFQYDQLKQSLKPAKEGVYFMYIQVTVSCTHHCKPDLLQLEVSNTQLTCDLELTKDIHLTPLSRKCWAVERLDGKELNVQMTIQSKQNNLRLDVNKSGFGMFLVE